MKTLRLLFLLSNLLVSWSAWSQIPVNQYSVYREKWFTQISSNALPFIYRFSAHTVGAYMTYAEISSPAGTFVMYGGDTSQSFGTNYPALYFEGTNITSGENFFNTFFPVGAYTLNVSGLIGKVPYARNYPMTFVNDFPSVDPVLTNINPLIPLQTTQTFSWPVFTNSASSYVQFAVLEGNLDTNILADLTSGGISAVTNQMKILALHWNFPPPLPNTSLAPSQNSVTVTNINPLIDHLVVLEFVNPNVVPNDAYNDADNYSANAVFFFALRILAQPESQTVPEGEVVTFNVFAVGALPLQYQWQFNSNNIPDATNLYHVIPAARKSDAGEYRVLVKNPSGEELSEAAMLTVTNPPPPVYLTLSKPVRKPNGDFQCLVATTQVGTYSIDASFNLKVWTEVGTVQITEGTNLFLDTSAAPYERRYYRAHPSNLPPPK